DRSNVPPTLFIGNRTLSKAQKVAQWIATGITKPCSVNAFHLPEKGITTEMKEILGKALTEQGLVIPVAIHWATFCALESVRLPIKRVGGTLLRSIRSRPAASAIPPAPAIIMLQCLFIPEILDLYHRFYFKRCPLSPN
ncbi:MAG: hypothetical protein KJN85_08705, partial [Maribacter sp.]|nr:hypothetical protein [Maribacter sp.]